MTKDDVLPAKGIVCKNVRGSKPEALVLWQKEEMLADGTGNVTPGFYISVYAANGIGFISCLAHVIGSKMLSKLHDV